MPTLLETPSVMTGGNVPVAEPVAGGSRKRKNDIPLCQSLTGFIAKFITHSELMAGI
jgi:hypothetical protein